MSSVGIGLFNSQEVAGLLDHAESVGLATRVGADGARVFVGKRKAAGTELDGIVQGAKGIGKILGQGLRLAEDIESKPGCGFFSDTGKAGQIIDESFKSRRNDLHDALGLHEIGETGQVETTGQLGQFLFAQFFGLA